MNRCWGVTILALHSDLQLDFWLFLDSNSRSTMEPDSPLSPDLCLDIDLALVHVSDH